MKMKKACEATSLTERAIRLYISKGLIVPEQNQGLIDFSPEDIRLLKDIALLRQLGFSIDKISGMIAEAKDIPAIIAERMDMARAETAHSAEVCRLLDGMADASFDSIHTAVNMIRGRQVNPELNFTQFDELTNEERQRERERATRDLARQYKRRLAGCLLSVALVLTVALLVFLRWTRIDGYINLAPVEVVAVQGNRATFRILNDEMAAVLGLDSITVPHLPEGFPPADMWLHRNEKLERGEVFRGDCQLLVRLTNFDLLCMGINPLRTFSEKDVMAHDDWVVHILQTMFADGTSDNACLMLNYFVVREPLLWFAE